MKGKKGLPKKIAALMLSAAVLWGVYEGIPLLGQGAESRETLAAALLRLSLGDHQPLWPSAYAALAISQSSLLTGGREAVLELRSRNEEEQEEVETPVKETPVDPETPPQAQDNGVPAKTLVPTSSTDYVVSGLAYINNTSDRTITPEELEGDYVHLGQGEPQVLIIHAHGSESYTMPPGQEYEASGDYRTTDTDYNVVRVGDELAAELAALGISVVHDRSLYDYPQYNGAYTRSLESTEAYLEKYPSIQFVLDIHRDAIADSEGNMYKVVSETEEGLSAQMTLVMGTDGADEHPGWRDNLRLAVALQNRLLEDYPTLMRPITLRNSRYNQHCAPGSLLVEVGAAGNSLDEALLAIRLFAKGLADVITPET